MTPAGSSVRIYLRVQGGFMSKLFLRALCASSFLSAVLSAQQGRGTIFGTVSDPSGAAIMGVKITILNTGTNTTVLTETNGEGYYTSPPLIVGNYEVSAEQAGFK